MTHSQNGGIRKSARAFLAAIALLAGTTPLAQAQTVYAPAMLDFGDLMPNSLGTHMPEPLAWLWGARMRCIQHSAPRMPETQDEQEK